MSKRVPEGAANTKQQVTTNKKRNRKLSFNRKTLDQVPTTKEVISLVNRKARENIEHKVFYVPILYNTASLTWPNTSGLIEDLSVIPQAVGVSARIGEGVIPTSLELRWMIYPPDNNLQSSVFNFRAIVCIMSTNSAAVNPLSVVHDVTTANNCGLISPYQSKTRTVRKILWDYQTNLFHHAAAGGAGSVSTAITENQSVGKVYIPLNRLKQRWKPIRFDGAGTSGENHIYLLTFTNLTVKGGMWNVYFYSTLNYTDA